MPLLQITTNIPSSRLPKNFAKKASEAVAHLTARPESGVQVTIATDAVVLFAGTDSPAATVSLTGLSLRDANDAKRSQMVRTLTDLVSQELSIHPDRFFITLYAIAPNEAAVSGKLFTEK